MVAGCVSEDGNYTSEGLQDSNPDISVNDAGDSQGEVNGTAEKESSYEASGYCYHVVDGDTIDVEGVGRIRLVGVNTPERGEPGYREATDFVKSMCLEEPSSWTSMMLREMISMGGCLQLSMSTV